MALKTKETVVAWTPETDADRRLVQEELSAILASPHFRNSKRYPALLRYVVEKSLDGLAHQLKERTLGIEVFDRRPDYDTNADPVVRFSAGEIRKRIAQYYRDADSDLQIELPLGSYAPGFRARVLNASSDIQPLSKTSSARTEGPTPIAHEPQPPTASMQGAMRSLAPNLVTRRAIWVIVAFAALLLVAGLVYRSVAWPQEIERVWKPLLATPGPVLIVVGSGNLELTQPESPETNLYDHMVGPYHHISLSSAVALSRLTSVLQQHNKPYFVKEAGVASLTDLRERSVVLIGALNNPWTLRLTEPLRYRFLHGPMAQIEDTQEPRNRQWIVDFSQPFSSVSRDYAIVARYHDTQTDGNVLIVAGLGSFGTEAAGQFLSSPLYLQQVAKMVPGNLNGRNLEMVIRTDVIAGEAGPPYLVAATAW